MSKYTFSHWAHGIAGMIMGVAATALPAQETITLAQLIENPDTIVATVNGEEVTGQDLLLFLEASIGDLQERASLHQLLPIAQIQLVQATLLTQQAIAEGIPSSPQFQTELKFLEKELARQHFIRNVLDERVNDAAIEARYAELEPPVHTSASHILVASQEEANDILLLLAQGADFNELARARSQDPSVEQNGGDMGFFTHNQMVPAFADAAFSAPVGTLIPEPVETQFGWHVIQVNDRKQLEIPPIELVRRDLAIELQAEIMEEVISRLEENSQITQVVIAVPPPLDLSADQ